MRLNPEFQRNLWLEMTMHRLVAMPLILLLIFGLIYSGSALYAWQPIAARTSVMIYFALTVLWGGKMAAEAVLGEMRDRTWDAQRMSSLGPWAMAWGKLLGSTIYSWYGAIFCLLVFIGTTHYTGVGLVKVVLLATGSVALAQSAALLVSLQVARKSGAMQARLSTTLSLLSAIVIAWFAWSVTFRQSGSVYWFGQWFDRFDFFLVSIFIYLCWFLLGIYRLMRAELQVRNTPLYWVLFSLFLAVYVAGFVPESVVDSRTVGAIRLFIAYNMMLALTYMMIFSERKDLVAFRRLFYNFGSRSWRRLFEDVPCWFVSFVLVILASLMLMFGDYPVIDRIRPGIDLNIYLAGGVLFLLRDIGIVLYLNLGAKPARADAAALLYLVVLYVLVPMLLSASGNRDMAGLFTMLYPGTGVAAIVSAGVQAGVMMVLLATRWRGVFGSARPG